MYLAADIRQTAKVLSSSGYLVQGQVLTIPIVLTTKYLFLPAVSR
jgi:hypothetical protein